MYIYLYGSIVCLGSSMGILKRWTLREKLFFYERWMGLYVRAYASCAYY